MITSVQVLLLFLFAAVCPLAYVIGSMRGYRRALRDHQTDIEEGRKRRRVLWAMRFGEAKPRHPRIHE